jgi:hypothetical protein
MNLKQFAGKVRDAVKSSPDEGEGEPEPGSATRPFSWDAPQGGFDAIRPAAAPPAAAPRFEAKPVAPKEPAPREAAPRPEVRRPEIGRTADVRPGTESTEGAGRAGRWKASTTVPDLVTVYKEAGIESPLHGYGVDKLTDMLASPHLANASRDVRATAAQVALDAARVPLRDIIDDALLRSKALAAFEADKAFDLQASQMRAERRAQVLRDQVDTFRRQKNAEIEELRRAIDAADQALAQLRARKRREEERLHRIVSHFVEPRPAVAAPAVARPAAPAPAVPRPAAPVTPPPAPSGPAPGAGTITAALAPASEPKEAPAPARPIASPPPAAGVTPAAPPAEPATSTAAPKGRV